MPSEFYTREEKLENIMKNHAMILTGVLDEALTEIAEKMSEPIANSATKGILEQQLRSEIGSIFSEIRAEIASEWPKNPKVFGGYVSGPAFDTGVNIVEATDFGRPSLAEKLDDQALASYVFLLKSGDNRFRTMFEELSDWLKTLPRAPWTT